MNGNKNKMKKAIISVLEEMRLMTKDVFLAELEKYESDPLTDTLIHANLDIATFEDKGFAPVKHYHVVAARLEGPIYSSEIILRKCSLSELRINVQTVKIHYSSTFVVGSLTPESLTFTPFQESADDYCQYRIAA